MSRLWSSGFELNTVSSEGFIGDAAPTIDATIFRSGAYSEKLAALTGQIAIRYQYASSASTGPFYFRCYLKIETAHTGGENRIIAVHSTSSTTLIRIGLTSSNTLQLRDEDGAIGSASSAMVTGTWNLVELMYDSTGVAGTHIVEAKLNGTTFASSSTRSLSAGANTLWLGRNLGSDTNVTGEWYFDDIAINNSSGSFENSWPGEGEIIHLLPDGAGDAADWTGASTDVDEVTPDDATTIIESTTLDQVEEVTLAATPAALESSDTINCVQVGVRFRADGASEPTFVLRIKSAAAGTVEESAGGTTTNTNWHTNASTSPRNYALTLYDLPGASTTAWTKTELDTAQIGVRISADATNNIEVSTLWLLVDHKPGEGGGGGAVAMNWPIMTGKKFWSPQISG